LVGQGRLIDTSGMSILFSRDFAQAKEVSMLISSILTLVLSAAQPAWHTDYDDACKKAMQEKKDLVIYFRKDDRLDEVLDDSEVKERLERFICLKVPASYQYKGERLLDHDALTEMMGRPGLAVVSLHDEDLPTNFHVISVHPFVRSRYQWVPDYGVEQVQTILDLPTKASLTQRSMIYAIRVHPERPQSVYAECHAAFLDHAKRHSARQAGLARQHHADIIAASNYFRSEWGLPVGIASEVVAESWGRVVGGENVLEAAFSSVEAWRKK